jgi:hypothetical protein
MVLEFHEYDVVRTPTTVEREHGRCVSFWQ